MRVQSGTADAAPHPRVEPDLLKGVPMGNSERRAMWLMVVVIVFLAVLALNSGCSTVQGLCKDVGSASRAIAEAAGENERRDR